MAVRPIPFSPRIIRPRIVQEHLCVAGRWFVKYHEDPNPRWVAQIIAGERPESIADAQLMAEMLAA